MDSNEAMLGAAQSMAGLASSVMSGVNDKKINRENIAYNKWALQQQERYNWEMWNATNQYNTPLAIKSRYAAAGLNPALMFKSGLQDSANLGSGVDPESYSPRPVRSPLSDWLSSDSNPFAMFQAMLAAEKTKADIAKTGADTRNVDASTAKFQMDTEKTKWEAKIAEIKSQFTSQEEKYKLDVLANEINEGYQRIALNVQKGELNDAEIEIRKIEKLLKEDEHKKYTIELQYLPDTLRSIISGNFAAARKSNADAYSVELENDIVSSISKDDRIESKKAALNQRIIDAGLSGIQLDQAQSIADILVNEKNTYKIRMWAGILTGLLSAGASVAKAGAAYR